MGIKVDRAFVLAEIRRTAAENGGVALGWRKFATVTGIRETDWLGPHWARWSDAVREAGLEPNKLNAAIPESELLERLAVLALELGRLPTHGDLRFRAANDPSFPTDKVFSRLGRKSERLPKLLVYCRTRPEFAAVASLCEQVSARETRSPAEPLHETVLGTVYLIKSGRHYKIGRSNSAGRRGYEIALQLPERAATLHVINTDDPVGIEAYWHRRFESKRANGEWFALEQADVAAFKRRKFM